ncbi:MAG TPA: hypothetical protein VFK88_04355 [Gallionella sp.]|nr:hypothetical protein [Gallionella sp.]
MKFKVLSAVCALAFAGQAAALNLATTQAIPATNTLFISGSSALQNGIGQIAQSLFVAGTLDVYFNGTAAGVASGNNYRAYSGTVAAGVGIPATLAGQNVVIYETGAGGSIMGVNPVALRTAVTSLSLTGCVAATAPATTDAITGAPLWSCPNTVATTVPDAGISDVEPALFTGINLPAGSTALSAAQLATLTSTVGIGQVMGVVVTSNVTAGNPAAVPAVPAKAPALLNLSKAQVAGLMGGTILDWSQVDSSILPGTTSIVVCRRQGGSGTQAAINASMFGVPCTSAPNFPSTSAATTAIPGALTAAAPGSIVVVENSSSGALAACMTAAQNGTPAGQAITLATGAMVPAGTAGSVVLPAGNYGIGLMGLDRPAKAGELYQFVSINGVAPTLANAVDGKYDIIVESTFNRPTAMAAGLKLDLYNAFVTKAGDPVVLGNPLHTVAGVAALSENAWVAPAAFTATNPVLKVGNFGNTCKPLQQLQ